MTRKEAITRAHALAKADNRAHLVTPDHKGGYLVDDPTEIELAKSNGGSDAIYVSATGLRVATFDPHTNAWNNTHKPLPAYITK